MGQTRSSKTGARGGVFATRLTLGQFKSVVVGLMRNADVDSGDMDEHPDFREDVVSVRNAPTVDEVIEDAVSFFEERGQQEFETLRMLVSAMVRR